MKATSLNDVIVAVVAALNAANLGYPVFDGPPDQRPGRTVTHFVCIGLADIPATDAEADIAAMDQVWYGLGERARQENLHIECTALGKANSAASARSLALGIVQDVANNLGIHPTAETFNALVSAVTAARVRSTTGGTVVTVHFTISAEARLV